MDSKNTELNSVMMQGLNRLEGGLKEEIEMEKRERKEESAEMQSKLEAVAQRVARLELGYRPGSQPQPQSAADDWQPNHLIFGGWPEGVNNEKRVAEVESCAKCCRRPCRTSTCDHGRRTIGARASSRCGGRLR